MCSDVFSNNNEMEPQNDVSVSVKDTVTINIKKRWRFVSYIVLTIKDAACTLFIVKCTPYQPGVYNVSLFIIMCLNAAKLSPF